MTTTTLELLQKPEIEFAKDKIVWTEKGQKRVAALIRASVDYRREHGLPFSSYVNIGKHWDKAHSTYTAYARGTVADPGKNYWMVIQHLQEVVFRVNHFLVDANGEVLDVSINPKETYLGCWRDLARIGTYPKVNYDKVVPDRELKVTPGVLSFIGQALEYCPELIATAKAELASQPALMMLVDDAERKTQRKRKRTMFAQYLDNLLRRLKSVGAIKQNEDFCRFYAEQTGGQDILAPERLNELINGAEPKVEEAIAFIFLSGRFDLQYQGFDDLILTYDDIPRMRPNASANEESCNDNHFKTAV